MIQVFRTSRQPIQTKIITEIADRALEKVLPEPEIDLNVIFVGKRKMRTIASRYKKEDVALPVLTFAYQEGEESQEISHKESTKTGEIFLCYPQIVLLAAEKDKTVDTMIEAMIVHGIENLKKDFVR